MFATLPDFTPRESHSLWYTSSRAPILGGLPDHLGGARANAAANSVHHPSGHHHQPPGSRRGYAHVLERTALARLAAEEAFLQRRRSAVQNYGSTWLKPPGIPKTLHQMREEKREQEEHHEAMRRERLAQELAEAEAEAAEAQMDNDGDDDDGEQGHEEAMDDVQLDGVRDLDDEIPDADDDFALGGGDSSDSDSDNEDQTEVDDDNDPDSDYEDTRALQEALREERRNDLVVARMRMTDDAFREALVRGAPDGDEMYGAPEEELDEHSLGLLMEERDFAAAQNSMPPSPRGRGRGNGDRVAMRYDDNLAAAMDVNLDDDIPEAEQSGYEHTDSDAALSSEDDRADNGGGGGGGGHDGYDDDVGFAPRTAVTLRQPTSPTMQYERRRRQSQARSSAGPRSSMDLSAFLSHDESSFMESSPVQGRRNIRGG